MILWVFIEFFWSQNSHYRYLPIFYRYLSIFYRYFTDIYRYLPIFDRYFFRNSNTSTRAPQSRFFGGKIGIFRFFSQKLTILPIFPRFFLLLICPLFFLLGDDQKSIFQRYINQKNQFFCPCSAQKAFIMKPL